jgi:hypothetical protein
MGWIDKQAPCPSPIEKVREIRDDIDQRIRQLIAANLVDKKDNNPKKTTSSKPYTHRDGL